MYTFDDKVWCVQEEFYVYEKCCYCDDNGLVKIKGDDFDCPNCHGEAFIDSLRTERRVIGPCEIISILRNKTYVVEYLGITFNVEEDKMFLSKTEAINYLNNHDNEI